MKKFYHGLIAVSGIATFIFLMLLAVSVTEQWWTGAFIGLGVSLVFGGIIAYGLYDMRARTGQENDFEAPEEICIPLAHPHPRLKFPALPFFISMLMFLGAINFLLFTHELESHALMAGINLGFIGLTLLIYKISTAPLQKARELVQRETARQLILNSQGLVVPLELLTKPAFHIALQEGVTSLNIPWGDIKQFEAHRHRGSSPRQFSLKVTGKTEKYGGLMGVFGIMCDSALLAQESKIIALAKRYLHNRVSRHFNTPH